MILRHVFIKLKEAHATDAGRDEVVRESIRALAGLPGVLSVAAEVPADEKSQEAWDVALSLRFDSIEEVEVYRADAGHRDYVSAFLRPRMEVIKAWNFRVAASAD